MTDRKEVELAEEVCRLSFFKYSQSKILSPRTLRVPSKSLFISLLFYFKILKVWKEQKVKSMH